MRGIKGTGKSVPYSTKEEFKELTGLKDKSVEKLREIEIGLSKYTRQAYMRMKKAGALTPMIVQLAEETSRTTKSGKKVLFARPSKDATKNKLINDIRSYKAVINSKYFNIKGGKEFAKYFAENFKNKNSGGDSNENESVKVDPDWAYNQAWKIFTRLKKDKQITDKSPDELIPEIYNILMDGKTVEEAINELYNKYGPQAVEKEDTNNVG